MLKRKSFGLVILAVALLYVQLISAQEPPAGMFIFEPGKTIYCQAWASTT